MRLNAALALTQYLYGWFQERIMVMVNDYMVYLTQDAMAELINKNVGEVRSALRRYAYPVFYAGNPRAKVALPGKVYEEATKEK